MAKNEFYTPNEFHTPSEFHKSKEGFTTLTEFMDRPGEYGAVKKDHGEDKAKARSKKLRKMMMYLATAVTSMGSLLAFSSAQSASFDKKTYIWSHRDWYCAEDDEYLYLGDDGFGWIALRSEDGKHFDDFSHFRRWCFDLDSGDDYSFTGYGYDIDWTIKPVDGKKVPVYVRLVKSDDGYVAEASPTKDFSGEIVKAYPVELAKAQYPGKDYMMKYTNSTMQDILNEFNTYVLENDAPVYTDFDKITFNSDGTGIFKINGKDNTFTYIIDEDPANCFITICYKGKTAKACFLFFGEKPTMMFFDGLVGVGDSFAAFIAVDPAEAGKKAVSKVHVNNGDNDHPAAPSDPSAAEPSKEGPKPIDAASCLKVKRDWYCNVLKTYVFFGSKNTGYAFDGDGDTPGADNYYTRFTYKTSGSKCECLVERFEFEKMKYKTEKWVFTVMDVGGETQLWLKSIIENGEHHVFKENPKDLNCYVDNLGGMNTADILRKFRRFNILEDSYVVNGITMLEFTGSDSGIIHYNENGESKEYPFTYSSDGNGIDSAFYLYYNNEKYVGQIFFSQTGPGITLFNPTMDGTHGKFTAG